MARTIKVAAAGVAIAVMAAVGQVQAQQVVVDNFFSTAGSNSNGTRFNNSGYSANQWTCWDDFTLGAESTLMGASFLFREDSTPTAYTFEIRANGPSNSLGGVLNTLSFAAADVIRTPNVLPSLSVGNPLDNVNQYDIEFVDRIVLQPGTYWVGFFGSALVTGANIAPGGNGFWQRQSSPPNNVIKQGTANGAIPFQLVEVPEPASLALWGMGVVAAVGLVGFRRRRRQQEA